MAFSESFPILYFNMAGEMCYIIDQRLCAQSVDRDKALKVLNDIALAMFNSKLISEVFKPHNTITFALLRSIFEKLAHSSIMRLNETSMNKLFDLMVMVVKYQLYACAKPSDLITLTDNHLSALQQMMAQIPETADLIATVRNQFLYHYQNRYDLLQLMLIRYSLLNLLKDIHTRVSIFLRENIQSTDGRFYIPTDKVVVECECLIPGEIRYFGANGIERTDKFDPGASFVVEDARTTLGLNIYRKEPTGKPPDDTDNVTAEEQSLSRSSSVRNQQNEIDLLAMLICKAPDNETENNVDFKFEFLEEHTDNSTDTSADQKQTYETNHNGSEPASTSYSFEPSQQHLIDIIKDLASLDVRKEFAAEKENPESEETDEVDYLELMDS